MFEAEGVAPGRRGGRGLGRLRDGALLRRVLGHLGEGHVVQLGRRLGPPEGVHLEDGLPLLDPLVDGELGEVRGRRSGNDFGPRAAAGLGRRALRPVCRHCRRRRGRRSQV